jgi:hypothetical protein
MPRPRPEARQRRMDNAPPTDREWLWLTAAPGHNRFLGFPGGRTAPGRLPKLWREHETEIRALWKKAPPSCVPYGHPAESEFPGCPEPPDPRRVFADPQYLDFGAPE